MQPINITKNNAQQTRRSPGFFFKIVKKKKYVRKLFVKQFGKLLRNALSFTHHVLRQDGMREYEILYNFFSSNYKPQNI